MGALLTTVVIDCRHPDALAAFWCAVLGWEVSDVDESDGSVEIAPPGRGHPTLLFEPVPEPKAVKNRLHLDVNPLGADQSEELERLLALGATRADVGQTGEETWHVLADPEGNEFCLLRTRHN